MVQPKISEPRKSKKRFPIKKNLCYFSVHQNTFFTELDQLLSMFNEIGQEQVVNNSLILNKKNEPVMAVASESILSSFKQAFASGRDDELLSMFQRNSSAEIMANPLAQEIQDGFAANVQQSVGLNSNVVKGLAVTLDNHYHQETSKTNQQESRSQRGHLTFTG
jgi:hypothetical protein